MIEIIMNFIVSYLGIMIILGAGGWDLFEQAVMSLGERLDGINNRLRLFELPTPRQATGVAIVAGIITLLFAAAG